MAHLLHVCIFLFILVQCYGDPKLKASRVRYLGPAGVAYFAELCSYLDREDVSRERCSKKLTSWITLFQRQYTPSSVISGIAKRRNVDPVELKQVMRDMVDFVELAFNEAKFSQALEEAPVVPLYNPKSAEYQEGVEWEAKSAKFLYSVHCAQNEGAVLRFTVYGRRIRDLVFESLLKKDSSWFPIKTRV